MSYCRFACLLVFTVLFTTFPGVSSAQIIPTLASPVEIQIVPEFPNPNSAVSASAQNIIDGDGLSYTWTVNGQVVVQGVGITNTTIPVGDVGERTTIGLIVRDGLSTIAEISRSILPTELDIVWEAETYTPPFYIGRPLPTAESVITVSAISNVRVSGVRIPDDSLTYEWYVNNTRTPYQTGYGLHTISITPPIFDTPFIVRVVAKTQNGSVAAQNSTTIAPRGPRILLYEKSPLLGTLFNNIVASSFTLLSEEVTLKLFPLFVTDPNQTLYSWELNNSSIDTGDTPREVTLRRTGDGSGQYTLSLSLETPELLFEEAQKRFKFNF